MSRLSIVVGICLLLLAGSLSGVTLEKLSLEEMIDASTLIVRGTVSSAKVSQGDSLLQTEYSVSVAEVLKGTQGLAEVTVSLPGGDAGGVRQTLAGVPSLEAGKEYVLFLWRARSGRWLLVGMTQGLLRVSGAGNRAMASRAPVDGTLLDPRSGMAVRDSGLGIRLPTLRETVSRRLRPAEGGRR